MNKRKFVKIISDKVCPPMWYSNKIGEILEIREETLLSGYGSKYFYICVDNFTDQGELIYDSSRGFNGIYNNDAEIIYLDDNKLKIIKLMQEMGYEI